MYDDVLLPVDGSEGATAVLEHVGRLARRLDAQVTLLYVADTARDSVATVDSEVVDALVERGEGVVERAAETLAATDTDHRTDVVQGNPAVTIVDYVQQYDHDLIAMPTRGREGLSRYLLGSVTETVVRLSPVPVLTARTDPDERLTVPYERLLVATDGSEAATRAARHGVALAVALGAAVDAVAAVDAPLFDGVLDDDPEGERAATRAVQAVADEADAEGVPVRTHVADGDPLQAILDRVETTGADAVVLGATGRRGTDRVTLGGVAEKTIRSAPVPVVTVPGPGLAD